MPLKNFTERKMGCQKRREGSMALLGLPHLESLGKRIKLALANSLVHYLSSTLQAKYDKRNKPWTDPIVSTL
jgi:hypothetical protein